MSVLAHNNKIIIAPNGKALLPPQSGGRLPAGYTEVESLSFDGSAYIDTGIHFTNGTKMIFNSAFLSDSTTNDTIVGTTNNTTLVPNRIRLSRRNNKTPVGNIFAYNLNSSTTPSTEIFTDLGAPNIGTDEDFSIEWTDSGMVYNRNGDTYVVAIAGGTTSNVGTIWIAMYGDALTSGGRIRFNGRVHFKDGLGEESAILIPCIRNSDNEAGYWRTDAAQFIPNSNTVGIITPGDLIISAEQILSQLEAIL